MPAKIKGKSVDSGSPGECDGENQYEKLMVMMMSKIDTLITKFEERSSKLEEIIVGRLHRLEEKVEEMQTERITWSKTVMQLKRNYMENQTEIILSKDDELTSVQVTGMELNTEEEADKFITKLGAKDIPIKTRFFQYNNKLRKHKLKVVFNNKQDKKKFTSLGRNLKGTHYRMSECHLPVVAQAINNMRKKAYDARTQGKDSQVIREKLFINNLQISTLYDEVTHILMDTCENSISFGN